MQTTVKLINVFIPENGLHLLVRIKIARKYHYLIIDTGASESVLDVTLPRYLFSSAKVNNQVQAYGIQSEGIKIKISHLKSLQIGSLQLKNVSFHLVDLSQIKELYSSLTNFKISGLIGSDFLNKYKATISYKTNQLILRY